MYFGLSFAVSVNPAPASAFPSPSSLVNSNFPAKPFTDGMLKYAVLREGSPHVLFELPVIR